MSSEYKTETPALSALAMIVLSQKDMKQGSIGLSGLNFICAQRAKAFHPHRMSEQRSMKSSAHPESLSL
jgi:hypothetical protein